MIARGHWISVEFLGNPARETIKCVVPRIPVVGDCIGYGDETLFAHVVYLTANPKLGDVDAIVRVKA